MFGKNACNVIGMIHVPALPGSATSRLRMSEILAKVEAEARLYTSLGLHGVIVENMHDTPYSLEKDLGPETTACMSVVASAVRALIPSTVPVGIQVLAAANRSALAAALAANLQFVRVEGFVFGHVADEGWIDGCAGPLLRYRKQIGGEHISVLADIKKKHSAHAVTADVNIGETAAAADFFRADGVIVTGTATGAPASPADLDLVSEAAPDIPVFIGSGITGSNLHQFRSATGLIIGTYFKKDGDWRNELDPRRIEELMTEASKFN